MKPIRFRTSSWSADFVEELIVAWLRSHRAAVLGRTPGSVGFRGSWWTGDVTGQFCGAVNVESDASAFAVRFVIDRSMLQITAAIPVLGLVVASFLFFPTSNRASILLWAPLLWAVLFFGQGALKSVLFRWSLQSFLEENGAIVERE